MSPQRKHCTFQPIAGTQRYICTECGFRTENLRVPPKVRQCDPNRKPKNLPPLGTQVVRYLSATQRWKAAGMPERTDDEVREILETHCSTCEWFSRGRCTHSGCGCNVRSPEQEKATFLGRYVHRGLSNKLRMATERCPEGKWRESGPVRVCFATPVWAIGGVERWLIDLAKWLDPQKARIVRVVVTTKGGLVAGADRWLPGGIELIQSEDLVDDGGFDLVVTWGQLQLRKLISKLTCPVIDVQHAVHQSDQWTQPLVAEATHARLQRGVVLAAVNELCRGSFRTDVRDSIQVIPNGADPDRIRPSGKLPINLPAGARMALFVGRVSPEKNVQVLIDSINHLGGQWHAVIAGPQRMPLQRITDRIHLLGPVQAIGELLTRADCLVHPSSYESHGLAVNEAWLAGLPVVSCDYPVNRQFQEQHGSLMWLVPVGPTAEQLGAAILQADRSDPRVDRARDVAEAEYTAEIMGRRWGELIWSVAREPSRKTVPGTV